MSCGCHPLVIITYQDVHKCTCSLHRGDPMSAACHNMLLSFSSLIGPGQTLEAPLSPDTHRVSNGATRRHMDALIISVT